MSLPPAAPAIGGTIVVVRLDRCWADASRVVGRPYQCRATATHPLGLCDKHVEELLPND